MRTLWFFFQIVSFESQNMFQNTKIFKRMKTRQSSRERTNQKADRNHFNWCFMKFSKGDIEWDSELRTHYTDKDLSVNTVENNRPENGNLHVKQFSTDLL